MLFSIPFVVGFLGVVLFLPAGNYYWINGWIFIGSMVFYILLVFIYFIIKDPETLEKRSKLTTEKGDPFFFVVIGIIFLVILLLPPLDYRYSWTQLPLFISWIGFTGLILSYFIILLVMRENSFASKGLMIHEGQKVITTGPYSIIRHPMYSSTIIMTICIPLTLGSLVSILPTFFIPFLLANRIKKEEKMLVKKLEGYEDYQNNVKYKLIPKLW
jgi:protein-S-isoprenylcysteine O-methyltransferase Ste14